MIKISFSSLKLPLLFAAITLVLTFILAMSIVPVTKGPLQEEEKGYCTMSNDCPSDKCLRVSNCNGNGKGFGCSIGKYTCEFKDKNLKEKYTEISLEAANKCLQDYISENSNKFIRLNNIMPNSVKVIEEVGYCHGFFNFTKNPLDTYCWYANGTTVKDPVDPSVNRFGVTFLIGAQTCQVYSDSRNEMEF